MLLPDDLKDDLPMTIANGVRTTTLKVWGILKASYGGATEKVKAYINECPALSYAQYNYTPPIHFAVREGHADLVEYLLFQCGAHDPPYRTYPFLDSLETIATERGHNEIAAMLRRYAEEPKLQKFSGDNGEIHYPRTDEQIAFQKAVNKVETRKVESTLREHPEWARDNTFFWGEGILCMPAKGNHRELMSLLMSHGATVPRLLKWAPAYYFERYDSAEFLLRNGMDPNTMSWHGVTLLHDMAQKGWADRVRLLVEHGADLDRIEDEYRSTPLGLAARWGHREIVEMLLKAGANVNRSGAEWSTPPAWATSRGHTEIAKMLAAN
jgi:ankyrin repeat protein